jgi:YD repeat-containing protein
MDPDRETSLFTWDDPDRLRTNTGANGNQSAYVYDDAGHQIGRRCAPHFRTDR